jgi:hypothetical protein
MTPPNAMDIQDHYLLVVVRDMALVFLGWILAWTIDLQQIPEINAKEMLRLV